MPYCTNELGEGPAWANSLFEDGAEFGYGIVCGYRQRRTKFISLVRTIAEDKAPVTGLSPELRSLFIEWLDHCMNYEISRQLRDKIRPFFASKTVVDTMDPRLQELAEPSNMKLWARTSFWIFGGDGFAYDIGFGGLDHVIANSIYCIFPYN